jgi:uncharacterized cupredoxin-like copper-binding protein
MLSRFAGPARLAPFALGLAAVLAACGGTTSTAGPAASRPAASAPAASAPGASGPAVSAPAAATVAVEAKDFAFTPSTISVPAGQVTFQVRNGGSQDHELEIFQGGAVVHQGEALTPGLTRDQTVTLAAGDYQFKCLIDGHDQLGMTGTLTVTGG